MQNDFTRDLLKYSAERDDCIGRPERWAAPPPLVVETLLFDEMTDFADSVWAGLPRITWYFLVGGPGNGKSEAVAKFVQQINSNAIKKGLPPVFTASKGRQGGSISYWFRERIPTGEIALLQDISVPKQSGSDPALDLLSSLESCVQSRVHLLACANRGMLLRATRHARASAERRWLVDLLDWIDTQTQDSATINTARRVMIHRGTEIEVRVWPLDHESVLFGDSQVNPWADPTGSLADQIISKAISEENWEHRGCAQCPARDFCPMLGDARWLRDTDRRQGFLRILRHAEVWSGQHIVLREALGLVSMVLVGCPSDFVEDNQELHPCDWVQRRVPGTPAKPRNEQALLELISHRIYQDLFGRPTPGALALDRIHQRRDTDIAEKLQSLGSLGNAVAKAIGRLDRSFPKQAGPLRLVGVGGILEHFDPAKDSSWCYKHSLSPDGQISDFRALAGKNQTALEHFLGDLFQALEDQARDLPPHRDPAKTFAALYRWASTYYLRLVGTVLGETPNAESLHDYLGLLNDPLQPIAGMGKQTTLRDLVKAASANGSKFTLAPSFSADLPPLQLRPNGARPRSTNPRWPANDRLTLQVTAAGSTVGPSVLLTATIFIDTWRKDILRVADWNISPAMENLMHGWREDFMVTDGQFRNLQSIAFVGKTSLEFESIGQSGIQVRRA